MNIDNLYYFVIIAEELNFTRASERLHISQQAVSNYVTKLEGQVGQKLFNRKPSLSLTETGKNFYDVALKILDIKEGFFTSKQKDFSKNIEIKMGLGYGRARMIGPQLIYNLNNRYPNIKVRLIEKPSTKFLEQSLLCGEIDCFTGISPIRSSRIKTFELSDEPLYFVCPKAILKEELLHKIENASNKMISEKNGISLHEFSDLPFLLPNNENAFRLVFNQYANMIDFRPKIYFESSLADSILGMSIDGVGATVSPRQVLNYYQKHFSPDVINEIIMLPIDEVINSKLVLCFDQFRKISDDENCFIEVCKTISFD